MRWIKVCVQATAETLETVQARLTGLGLDCFQVEDERDVLERCPSWDFTDRALLDYYSGLCRVVLYLPDAPDGRETLALVNSHFEGVTKQFVDEEDWAENWKQYYKPFLVGARLLVQPAWEPPENPDGRVVFLNNPGMTFGTGLHASTRLCLELLEARELFGARVLDIGSGSGILAICARLLGAREAVCVDIDPLSADVSARNAADNAVTVVAHSGDFLSDAALRGRVGEGFDVILSNIVADVIIGLAPVIGALLTPGGVWISSGVIDTRLDDVREALASEDFTLAEVRERGGWAALVATR